DLLPGADHRETYGHRPPNLACCRPTTFPTNPGHTTATATLSPKAAFRAEIARFPWPLMVPCTHRRRVYTAATFSVHGHFSSFRSQFVGLLRTRFDYVVPTAFALGISRASMTGRASASGNTEASTATVSGLTKRRFRMIRTRGVLVSLFVFVLTTTSAWA